MFQLLFKVGYLCIYEPSFISSGLGISLGIIASVGSGVESIGIVSTGVGFASSDVLRPGSGGNEG